MRKEMFPLDVIIFNYIDFSREGMSTGHQGSLLRSMPTELEHGEPQPVCLSSDRGVVSAI